MNINKANEVAATHFLRTYPGGRGTQQLFYDYAIDELELTPEHATEFGKKTEEGIDVKELDTKDDLTRFYTWYYINHVVKQD